MKPQDYVADFDSASAMVRAIARTMRHKDMRALGTRFAPFASLARPWSHVLDRLPAAMREQVYIWSGFMEALPARKLHRVESERISSWVADAYPKRRHPAVAVGSSNGALTHLWSALGIPWLPQTFLIPVRRSGIPPDEPRLDMEWGREPGRTLLDRNPDLQLHHMNDANQDRLMIQRMTYFRVKRRILGETYERFLRERLEPGGTIFISECELSWGTRRIGERHVFQHGAPGGAEEHEYHEGSPRVTRYLHRYGSRRLRWDSPGADGRSPEAEWGFEPSLRDDIERFARQHGYRVRRLVYETPEDPSPFVADLYRWWYAQRGMDTRRLFASSFILFDPYWTLRTGSAPFWMLFNKEGSLQALTRYLASREPFDEIYLSLFSHGVQSVGLPSLHAWSAPLASAKRCGAIVGIDEKSWPRDFGNFVRFSGELRDRCAARYPLPAPLALEQLDRFLAQAGARYAIRWCEGAGAPRPAARAPSPAAG